MANRADPTRPGREKALQRRAGFRILLQCAWGEYSGVPS